MQVERIHIVKASPSMLSADVPDAEQAEIILYSCLTGAAVRCATSVQGGDLV